MALRRPRRHRHLAESATWLSGVFWHHFGHDIGVENLSYFRSYGQAPVTGKLGYYGIRRCQDNPFTLHSAASHILRKLKR